jgi:hypothetical protein
VFSGVRYSSATAPCCVIMCSVTRSRYVGEQHTASTTSYQRYSLFTSTTSEVHCTRLLTLLLLTVHRFYFIFTV